MSKRLAQRIQRRLMGEPDPIPLHIRALLRIGFVRLKDDRSVRWPFHIHPKHMWRFTFRHEPPIGFFRNLPRVVKWEKGRLLPRRWGIRIFIFEFGDRG